MTKKQKTVPKIEKSAPKNYRQHRFIVGCLLVLIAVALLVSFISYYVTGEYDQSQINSLLERGEKTQNWLGKLGAYLADFFIYKGFGVASIIFVKSILMIGIYFILDISIFKLRKTLFWDFYLIITFSLLFGFWHEADVPIEASSSHLCSTIIEPCHLRGKSSSLRIKRVKKGTSSHS